ncbi:N-acetyltransferase family protein [Thalassotalea aquiviva]|uniref:GNAT family N-acetyltransferase n=1 Tax=Thalassotalea aquiviva TaxID=3242415 RepID=UPI00352BC770
MNDLVIRDAVVTDAATILHFVRELAIFEKAEHEVQATEDSIQASIFSADSVTKALICEKAGVAVGFAVYFFNYSTWLSQNGLFLEDLYVSPEHRGGGAGKALLKHLAKIAVEKQCGRFEWNVLDWNQPAIDFYQSLGAKPLNEWVGYRLTGDSLMQLANS